MNVKDLFSRGAFTSADIFSEAGSEAKEHLCENVCRWRDIYRGEGNWRYARKGGLQGGFRRVKGISAAKALCSEMAALCFSQQMDISFGDADIDKFAQSVLQENNFWVCFPLFLEKMFALGSGVIKVYSENGDVKLNFIDADAFLPLQYDNKGVYGGTAFSFAQRNGASCILAENHSMESDGCLITNRLMKKTRGGDYKRADLGELYPSLQEKTFIKGLKKPLIVYFRPACAGESGCGALGSSVYASASDTLEGLDIIFDSLQREFILGKKRIIVPVSALRGEYGSDGKLHKYFDEQDEVFQAFSADDKEELKIFDNSGELRVDEHIKAIEELLDLLCMQVGLSAGSLSYHSSTASTATEVIARNDKTFRTKTAHQQLIREGITRVLENILLLGVLNGKLSADKAGKTPVVSFSDSVSRDNSSKIENALKLFNAGVIDKDRVKAEVYGLTLDEAKEEQ